MAFAETGWCDPMLEEHQLELAQLAELELLAHQHTEALIQLVAAFESERARCIARHELAREALWRRAVVRDRSEPSASPGEQRRDPS